MKKNVSVQSVRGILCLMIVFYHYTARYASIYSYSLPRWLVNVSGILVLIGMCNFSFISGYYSYRNSNESRTAQQLVLHRILRLYPPYLLAIIAIFMVGKIGGYSYLGNDRVANINDLLYNAIFLNIPLRTKYIDGSHWYVSFMIIINTYIAILQRGLREKYRSTCYNLHIVTLSLLTSLTSLMQLSISSYLLYTLLIFFGIKLRITEEEETKSDDLISGILIAVALLLHNMRISNVLVVASVFYTSMVLRGQHSFLENSRFLQWFGDRSYHIYLFHQNPGYMAINYFISLSIPYVVSCLIAFLFILLFSSNIIYKIDKYLMKFRY